MRHQNPLQNWRVRRALYIARIERNWVRRGLGELPLGMNTDELADRGSAMDRLEIRELLTRGCRYTVAPVKGQLRVVARESVRAGEAA